MDKPALQSALWEKHNARVPSDDPVWVVAALIEEYLSKREAKSPLSARDMDQIIKKMDDRMARRWVRVNRLAVAGFVAAGVALAGISYQAGVWRTAAPPGLCWTDGGWVKVK